MIVIKRLRAGDIVVTQPSRAFSASLGLTSDKKYGVEFDHDGRPFIVGNTRVRYYLTLDDELDFSWS